MLAQLVRAPAHIARDPGSNPGPGENFFLKLTTQDLSEGYSEKLNFHQLSATVVLYKILGSVFNIIHHLHEYYWSALKEHCQTMNDRCKLRFLVGAGLVPSMEFKMNFQVK